MKELLRGGKLALIKLQDHLLFSAIFRQTFIESGRKMKLSISLPFLSALTITYVIVVPEDTECQRLCEGKTSYAPIHDVPDQNSLILPITATFWTV